MTSAAAWARARVVRLLCRRCAAGETPDRKGGHSSPERDGWTGWVRCPMADRTASWTIGLGSRRFTAGDLETLLREAYEAGGADPRAALGRLYTAATPFYSSAGNAEPRIRSLSSAIVLAAEHVDHEGSR